MSLVLLSTSLPTEEEAERVSTTLVEERLVACAKWFPASSAYWWDGKPVKDREYEVLLVTQKGLFPMVERRIRELHSYCLPQIVELPISRTPHDYRDWVIKETLGEEVR